VKFDMRRPCNNCPFRSDIKFPLELERVEEIVHSITGEDKTFTCHKTTKFDDDGDNIPRKDDQHCAGALIMLERMENPNQMMRIAERLGVYDRHKLDMNYAPVYEHGDDMIASGAWIKRGRMRAVTNNAPTRSLPTPKSSLISRWPEPARFIKTN
jgi:Family of unknown function (DUF6283)